MEPTLSTLWRFEIKEVLGQGAFGRVYRAYDPQLDRMLALKVPLFSQEEKQKAARFQAEAKAAGRLRHPNIVPTFDSGSVEYQFYIASQFIEGKSLSSTIKEKKIEFKQAAKWTAAIARALDYAHEMGIVHRYFKPHNMMLDGPPHAVLAQILTREPTALETLDKSIPKDLAGIAQKAMSKVASQRHQSCGELAEDLQR